MICARCGVELDTLPMGSWPFCHGSPADHAPARSAVISDRLPNPWIENLDHEPVYCETKQDLQREMDARHLRLVDKWLGPQDKHLTNWAAAIDAKTLDDKRVLLSRGSRGTEAEPEIRCETLRTSIRDIKTWSEVES